MLYEAYPTPNSQSRAVSSLQHTVQENGVYRKCLYYHPRYTRFSSFVNASILQTNDHIIIVTSVHTVFLQSGPGVLNANANANGGCIPELFVGLGDSCLQRLLLGSSDFQRFGVLLVGDDFRVSVAPRRGRYIPTEEGTVTPTQGHVFIASVTGGKSRDPIDGT